MTFYSRRLPLYLLLDCSESMAGEAIEAVHKGINSLISDLRSNPIALETVAISVISFANIARQVVPLTDLLRFYMPKLRMGSGTALGSALELWQQCVEREVIKTSADQKGDYKPICFILTDGDPTDSWQVQADIVRTKIVGKKANVIVAICGPDGDRKKMQKITESIIDLKDTNPGTFAKFFQWVSASMSVASQKIEGATDEGLGLPELPQEIVAPADRGPATPDRFVFLHARCVKSRDFYILRFAKQGSNGIYKGQAAHPVEDFEFEQGVSLKVNASQLEDASPCPFCGNTLWAKCSRGHIHCCPVYRHSVVLTCPWCDATDTYSAANFDVGRGQG